jgi:hypothetical protein
VFDESLENLPSSFIVLHASALFAFHYVRVELQDPDHDWFSFLTRRLESQESVCRLVFIEGVPHLRLGKHCVLACQLECGEMEPRPHPSLDREASRLVVGSRSILLTRAQLAVVAAVLAAQGEVVSYADLSRALRGDGAVQSHGMSIRPHASKIRQKLRSVGIPEDLILTVPGRGLRLGSEFLPHGER